MLGKIQRRRSKLFAYSKLTPLGLLQVGTQTQFSTSPAPVIILSHRPYAAALPWHTSDFQSVFHPSLNSPLCGPYGTNAEIIQEQVALLFQANYPWMHLSHYQYNVTLMKKSKFLCMHHSVRLHTQAM